MAMSQLLLLRGMFRIFITVIKTERLMPKLYKAKLFKDKSGNAVFIF